MLFAFAVLAGAAGASHAVDAGEITFWESVRDSKDAAELRAYLQRYPDGTFAVLAQRRLAVLESASRPVAPAAPAAAAVATTPPRPPVAWTMPSAGDTWTYTLREPKRTAGFRAGTTQRKLVVTVASASAGEVVDQASVDDATPPQQVQNLKGPHLLAQGASVFSPYLQLLGNVPAAGSIGRVRIVDPACTGRYICDASARVAGKETVRVPAGTFNATKIIVEHSWRSAAATAGGGSGARTLTIWYAPEAKRAVKYVSRTTFGVVPPIEADFELELVSLKVN